MQRQSSGGDFDLVVIGAGIFGSSIAWESARRGYRTALLERGELPNPIGASFGPSRKIRSSYVEPHYARLAHEAMVGWREIERRVGAELYVQSGNLAYTALDDQPHLDELERVSRQVGSGLLELDQQALRQRFPQLRLARRALFEERAGFLRATACVRTIQELARQHGSTLQPRCEVSSIEPSGDGLKLSTTAGVIRTERAVATAGGWSNRLFPELAEGLRQTQQGLLYLGGVPPAFHHPQFVPFSCPDHGFYGFPAEPGVGLKVAQHTEGAVLTDPDFDRATPPAGFREAIEGFVRDHLGLEVADYQATYDSCMYNLSNSNDFLLDYHPEIPRLFIATAGSGHGFKFGSVLGKLVLDRLDGAASDWWSPLFSYERFARVEVAARLL